MKIHAERVVLRPITMNDLDDCIRWANDPDVMIHTANRVFTEKEEREWLEGILSSDHEKVFIISNEHGRSIGTCGIHLKTKDPQLYKEQGIGLGIMIGETSEWGKGYGPEVVRALARYIHREYKEDRVWLTVDATHQRAIRAYEKAGFTKVRLLAVPERSYAGGEQWLMETRFS